jgi:hypothetical protein
MFFILSIYFCFFDKIFSKKILDVKPKSEYIDLAVLKRLLRLCGSFAKKHNGVEVNKGEMICMERYIFIVKTPRTHETDLG